MADGASIERWPSLRELAGLPGMPETHSGVVRLLKREGWEIRKRVGRGGGAEVNPACLPDAAQRELRRRAAISAANSAARAAGQAVASKMALADDINSAITRREREAGNIRAAGVTGRPRERMNARLDLIGVYEQFARSFSGGKCHAQAAFCAAYSAGEIYVANHIRQIIGAVVSPATLRRWMRRVEKRGLAALCGGYGNRKGCGLIDAQQALNEFCIGIVVDKPHISGKNLWRVATAHFAGSQVQIPTSRTFVRFLKALKRDHAQMYTAIANPDEWKNRYMPAFGSASEDVVRLNQRWELDSTPADVLLNDGRYTIVQVCDINSRRRMFFVAKTSSAAAVCEAIRRAVIAWGVPEEVKIDNGKDYVSERVQRALRGLGTQVLISPPFSPWKKPHVERGFRTFLHGLFEMLPGYIGHNVAQAQEIRASKSFAERMFVKGAVVELRMSADDLQKFCDRWCAIYENEPTQGLNGLTPLEQVARFEGDVRRIDNERVLDLLLAEAPAGDGGRTITKKGLRVEGYTYIAPELGGLVGERVQVLYDERDIGRVVVYRDEAFVCVAECPEIAGVSRAEIAAATTALTKQRLAEQRAAMRKLKGKIKKVDLIETALATREQLMPPVLPPAQNVIDATSQFNEAQRAVEALDEAVLAEVRDVEEVRAVKLQVLTEARAAGRMGEDEPPEQRFKWAIEQLLLTPAERTEFEARRLADYCEESEFSGRWMLFEDFGRTAFPFLDERSEQLRPGGALENRRHELKFLSKSDSENQLKG